MALLFVPSEVQDVRVSEQLNICEELRKSKI